MALCFCSGQLYVLAGGKRSDDLKGVAATVEKYVEPLISKYVKGHGDDEQHGTPAEPSASGHDDADSSSEEEDWPQRRSGWPGHDNKQDRPDRHDDDNSSGHGNSGKPFGGHDDSGKGGDDNEPKGDDGSSSGDSVSDSGVCAVPVGQQASILCCGLRMMSMMVAEWLSLPLR